MQVDRKLTLLPEDGVQSLHGALSDPLQLFGCALQSIVDVFVNKDVTPSTIQRAGSILLYRVEVGVRSNASKPATTVTMVDAMPEGMALVAMVEEPEAGGGYNKVTCPCVVVSASRHRTGDAC
jgi:hypothetical protein